MRSAIHDERRTAPAVREYHNSSLGPSAQWARHHDHAAEQDALALLLWNEGWTTAEIADYLGVGRGLIRELVTARTAA